MLGDKSETRLTRSASKRKETPAAGSSSATLSSSTTRSLAIAERTKQATFTGSKESSKKGKAPAEVQIWQPESSSEEQDKNEIAKQEESNNQIGKKQSGPKKGNVATPPTKPKPQRRVSQRMASTQRRISRAFESDSDFDLPAAAPSESPSLDENVTVEICQNSDTDSDTEKIISKIKTAPQQRNLRRKSSQATKTDKNHSQQQTKKVKRIEIAEQEDSESEFVVSNDDASEYESNDDESDENFNFGVAGVAVSEQDVAGFLDGAAQNTNAVAGVVASPVGNANVSDDDDDDVIAEAPPRRRRAPVARQTLEERKLKAQEKLWSHHPELKTVWEELAEMPRTEIPESCPQPPNVTIKLLPFQLEGVHWLRKQEESRFAGGVLADEMGMGKTIQIISLLVSDKGVKPNLILTPTVAIMQWLAELRERVTQNFLKICVFHGTNRETSQKNLELYDVVLSTYAILESLYRKQQSGFKRKGALVKESSILHNISWGRVILDEAHSIKDRSSSTARAVFNLKANFRWSVTGTPLQNRVGELYSLIRFMDAEPFSNYFCRSCPCKLKSWTFSDHRHCDSCGHISHQHFCWWNAEILKPIQLFGGVGEGRVAFDKLGILLDRIMLRRTKLERADDLGLPPRVVVVRRDVFNQAEEELYESLYTNSKRQFSTYVASNTVLNNYASIFSLLSRMRLAVNHPDLVTTKLRIKANEANESLVCGICQDVAEDAVVSKCKHVFCREDVREYLLSNPEGQTCNCPVCFRPLSIDLSQQEYEGPKGGATNVKEAAKTSIVNYIDMTKWRSSTKIEALVEELTIMQRDDATTKSIVFSQFVAFLDIIQWRLSRAGFNCVKLDGRMTPQSRQTVINSFMTDPSVTIFLVSLKAGGVALNLTEASRVFILDPWWNPAVEDQAFDRIHRLGQHRSIRITRLIIENSIESRILQLQEKKKMLFQSTVGKDMEALAKLSEEDLAFLFVL